MGRTAGIVIAVVAALSGLVSPARAQGRTEGTQVTVAERPVKPQAPVPSGGGETIEVRVRIVPFYAVDGDGHPVRDLCRQELELRIDGKPVDLESLSPPAPPNGLSAAAGERSPR
jgi:hypothetical protein